MGKRSTLRPVRERTKEDWGNIIRRFDELQRSERESNSQRADHIGVGYYYELLAKEFRLSYSHVVKIISSRHNR